MTEGDAGAHRMVGALSTRGAQIIDATGTAVQIAAVNWFGLETTSFAPHGLHLRNWQEMMDQMAGLGFNAIRLPFSAEAIQKGGTPSGIDFNLNPDLAGLTPIQIIDRIVAYAGEIGLRIILDHHRSSAGNGPNGNGLWHEGEYTTARWVRMWEGLAERYAGNPTVIGAELHNEPHGANWKSWAHAAEIAGNAVLAKNPDWLVLVEGVGEHNGEHYWWGGNLIGARDRPVVLSAPDKLVYAPHDYPNSVYPQPFFYAADFPENLPAIFDRMWGYLAKEGIAPVLVSEMGSRLSDPRDVAWLDKLVAYLSGDTDANGVQDLAGPGLSYAWWSWNPNSGDTGGILADDWRTVLPAKIAALDPILPDPPGTLHRATFDVTLTAAPAEPVLVHWRTVPGSAGEADFVAAAGILIFEPGETRRSISIDLLADSVPEGTETTGSSDRSRAKASPSSPAGAAPPRVPAPPHLLRRRFGSAIRAAGQDVLRRAGAAAPASGRGRPSVLSIPPGRRSAAPPPPIWRSPPSRRRRRPAGWCRHRPSGPASCHPGRPAFSACRHRAGSGSSRRRGAGRCAPGCGPGGRRADGR
ncbi:MAG: hypothetical protein B7Z53_05010 [Rhodospirillales bacterium 12-71-4]|nr:MAG: hypothetical protein B7Z53_05010 [Rhodospirillales bacterium 12-71-4]